MLSDDAADNGKPKSCSLWLCRKEGIPNTLKMLLWNAFTGIFDGYHEIRSRLNRRDSEQATVVHRFKAVEQ